MTGHSSSNKKTSPLVSLLSGGISGVIAKSTIAPLERVKILYQVKSEFYSSNTVYGSMKKIIKNEGLSGLWKGNTATILRIFPYSAIQWASYEFLKKNFVTDLKNSFQIFLAGSAGVCFSILITYPLDVLRARYAVHNKVATTTSPIMVKTATTNGTNQATASILVANKQQPNIFKGVWRGISPTLLGAIPYAGVGYSSFEYFKRSAPNKFRNEKGEVIGIYKLITGGIAGGLGQTAAYPLDVVRRRVQTTGFGDGKGIENYKTGTFKVMYQIFKQEGIYSLFKGISINYVKVIPTNGVAFLTYDTLVTFFSNKLGN